MQLETAITRYYTRYYCEQLGLPDWARRVEARLDEERTFAEPVIKKIEGWINYTFQGKRVLVVGAGTGAESVMLARRGAQVFAIEPDARALEIIRLKAQAHNITSLSSLAAVAESIPFPGCHFDFVYCYTVLEHVQNVENALDEMIRVSKPDGYVFIQTPDYRVPYEGHYKLLLVPFAPRWVQSLYLRLKGRPVAFLKTLNFLTAPQLDRMLWRRNVVIMRIAEPGRFLRYGKGIKGRLLSLMNNALIACKDQYIFLRKKDV